MSRTYRLLISCFLFLVFTSPSVRAQSKLTNESCLECHTIDQKIFNESAHGSLNCVDCHADIKDNPHQDKVARVNCGSCHEDMAKQFVQSVHFKLARQGVKDLPSCAGCHGTHNIFPKDDPRSSVNHMNIGEACLKCHASKDIVKRHPDLPSQEFVSKYLNSVHARGVLLQGLNVSATCTDCHGSHGILAASDAKSSVSHDNVPHTCGKCHEGIYNQYAASIHGSLWMQGRKDVPVCTSCHGEHAIADPQNKNAKQAIPYECGHCHQARISTYSDTFHGQASSLGLTATAKCSDCHTAHQILPEKDPQSSVNKANLQKTCAQCHSDITKNFIGYDPHINPHDKNRYFMVFFIYEFMKFLLISVFLFWGIHTMLWFQRSVVALLRREFVLERPNDQYIRRFSDGQRKMHGIIVVSFLGLVMTGLPLKFYYTPWAQHLSVLLGGVETSRYFHRVFGLVTLGYFSFHVLHMVYLVIFKKQRHLVYGPSSLMPRGKDWVDFVDNIKWFFYLGPRPKYDRWTYFEKFDYMAVFWGVCVIGISGLVMWFPVFFTKFLPGEILNIAAIVHSDEALLALAFIFTVHFFHNHLRVENFPIDLSIFSGVIPLERFMKERPVEYERLVKEGKLKELLVPPPSQKTIIKCFIFGFSALGIGGLLIIAIFITYFFH